MSDADQLQGLWKIQSPTLGGPTHYLIQGNSLQEFVPNFVSDGKFRQTYELDESTSPRRMVRILDYNGPDGPPDPNAITLKYLYELNGDKLVLCQGIGGTFPTSISGDNQIVTLIRDLGPVPQSRQPSNTPPIVDTQLGLLKWDDNLNWYEGEIEVAAERFELMLKPDHGKTATKTLARAKHIVTHLDRYRQLAADYAVDGLLSLKNCEWLDEEGGEAEVTSDEFKSRIELDAITVSKDGSVNFSYFDDGLFFGHMISVDISPNDQCIGAHI